MMPSKNAPSDERSAAIAKQLRTVLSGKPQSRQAMKLAKSVSRYAPVSTPSWISPRLITSTRPFHISGFSSRSLAKYASISPRRSSAKRQGAGSKRRSSRANGMIGISLIGPEWSQPMPRGSSLDRAFADDDRVTADRRAGQPGAPDSEAQFHHTGPAHFITPLNA